MKSTAERLSEAYCRPNNSEWVDLIGYVPNRDTDICAVWDIEYGVTDADALETHGLSEIPTDHFTDLLRDTIVPWRLLEDGFQTMNGIVHTLELRSVIDSQTVARRVMVITDTGKVYLHDGPTNVTTYTQLLTLIELIG
jgi:hypothetical protein